MPDDTSIPVPSRSKQLVDAAYPSPYSYAPRSQPNTDPYTDLCASALSPRKAMGYDPKTMAERGVVLAEDQDQDPFRHVMHSQYIRFLGACFHRSTEGYDEWLSIQEEDDLIHARTLITDKSITSLFQHACDI